MGQFIAAHTSHSASATNQDGRLGKWLREYPTFAEAFANGAMTVAHLNHIRIKIDNARTYLSLRAQQARLADAARDCSFQGFKKVCDYWLVHIDPDGKEPIDQIESTRINMRNGQGGRLEFSGSTDAVSGHALINMVMSLEVAEWAADQLKNPGADFIPVDPFDIDGRCELIDGTPVHPLLVAAVAGLHLFDQSTLRRYVLEADSRIIDYSVNARTAPEYMRTASHVEHRGACGTEGCDARHTWLEMDHVDPHSNDGPTSQPP